MKGDRMIDPIKHASMFDPRDKVGYTRGIPNGSSKMTSDSDEYHDILLYASSFTLGKKDRINA